ncbi:MAG TPA: tetratricopeptide repeat protein [Longimicrobium sp.]|nr:tetratricopeptide repeat protein [Longimicrobium sp.]
MPPPLVQRIESVGFTGTDLLEEGVGDPVAVFALWRCFRDAELWGITAERTGLFQPGSAEALETQIESLDPVLFAALKPHLKGFAEMLRWPEKAEASTISSLCATVATWFEEQGRLRCAVEFAVAAHHASPNDAGFAVRVARLTRVLAEYPRSKSWFDYSLYLARRANDQQAYTEALAGMGNLFFQIGNFPKARHYHERCLRVASRNRLHEMVGAACHNLFTLEMESGKYELAQDLAARAVEAYAQTPTSPCIVRLARDLAHRWTVLGFFERALPLAVEMLNHFHRPVDRAQVWAGVGRAAGGAGDGSTFEDAWIETWSLVKRGLADPYAADVLIDLAHGAASLGDIRRAEHAAREALRIARERKEGHSVLVAEALLDSVRAKPLAEPPTPQNHATSGSSLEARLLLALQGLRAAAA